MKRALLRIAPLVICTAAVLYVASMVAYPFYASGIDEAMATWARWQTLNTGMLGLLGAIITIWYMRSSGRRAESQRFQGGLMELSDMLARLTEHNQQCFRYLDSIHGALVKNGNVPIPDHAARNLMEELDRLNLCTLERFSEHSRVFKYFAENAGEHPNLVKSLHRLSSRIQLGQAQVFQYRAKPLKNFTDGNALAPLTQVAIYITRTQAYINRLWPFARNHKMDEPYEDRDLRYGEIVDGSLTIGAAENSWLRRYPSGIHSKDDWRLESLLSDDLGT